jgi:hypothetical protein
MAGKRRSQGKRARGERIGSAPFGFGLGADGLRLVAVVHEQAAIGRARDFPRRCGRGAAKGLFAIDSSWVRGVEAAELLVAPHRYFSDEELAPLLVGLRDLGFEIEVRPRENPFVEGRAGVTWCEVIHVYLPAAGALAVPVAMEVAKGLATDGTKALAKKVGAVFLRWARHRGRRPGKNPKQPSDQVVQSGDQVVQSVGRLARAVPACAFSA